jgi:glutamate 5-kinase
MTKTQNNGSKRIVIKVGSSTLTDENGCLDRAYIRTLVDQIASQVQAGVECVLVSSGAIRAGRERLNINGRPKTIPEKQAAAAVGQGLLMHTYAELFNIAGIAAAQILLTRDDLKNRVRYLNARNTLNMLLDYGCVPIINENDTVAIEEIKFGDNDTLAALVASGIRADLLILLSDVPGLCDRDPKLPGCKLIPEVKAITPEIRAIGGDAQGDAGTGGMRTKLDAAEIANKSGVEMVIADGRRAGVIGDVVAGKSVGTRFAPSQKRLSSKKRWIAFSSTIRGTVTVNEGARNMIVTGGKSLLPAGITEVHGTFKAGDLVAVADEGGKRIARGIVSYGAADIRLIAGRKTSEIEEILGFKDFDEVIHRDNLVIGV